MGIFAIQALNTQRNPGKLLHALSAAAGNTQAALSAGILSSGSYTVGKALSNLQSKQSLVENGLGRVSETLNELLGILDDYKSGWEDAKDLAMTVRDDLTLTADQITASNAAFLLVRDTLVAVTAETRPGGTKVFIDAATIVPYYDSAGSNFTVPNSQVEADTGTVSAQVITNSTNAGTAVTAIDTHIGNIQEDIIQYQSIYEMLVNVQVMATNRASVLATQASDNLDVDTAEAAAVVSLASLTEQQINMMIVKVTSSLSSSVSLLSLM